MRSAPPTSLSKYQIDTVLNRIPARKFRAKMEDVLGDWLDKKSSGSPLTRLKVVAALSIYYQRFLENPKMRPSKADFLGLFGSGMTPELTAEIASLAKLRDGARQRWVC